MSKGSGKVERRIAALFADAAPDREDRTYPVSELAAAVFATDAPTRSQRLSVKRAARSAIARLTRISRHANDLEQEAWQATVAAFGREPRITDLAAFARIQELHPSWIAARKIRDVIKEEAHLVRWGETMRADGATEFHHGSRPVRCWAVSISRSGVEWFEASIEEITADRVSIRYQGTRCPLDRWRLAWHGAWWRGVCFVTRQDGRAASMLWEQWQTDFGHLEPLHMPLDQACQMLGVPANYSREDVVKAFRRLALKHHPDHGGDAGAFQKLTEARNLLLSLIGMKAERVKEPAFRARGVKTIYTTWRPTSPRRIGNRGGRLLA